MASYFTLTLDTTAPTSVSISLPALTNSTSVTATIAATGASHMKFWGDVSGAATEGAASWQTFGNTATITLTSGDGTKTVYMKVKDDVGNEATAVNDTTVLDSSGPTVTITGPDVNRISKVASYDTSAFSFSANEAFVEYKVKVVPSTSSVHSAGTQIGTTGGSTNMSGSGTFAANTPISCTIKGADLETASVGDGAKIVKVFCKDANGNWSV